MGRRLSRTVYGGLVAFHVPRVLRRLRAAAPVFCFHNVVSRSEAGVGDASLHMPVDAFQEIVRWMAATYEVVSLLELADRCAKGRSVQGLAAITFDDAYRGVFEHALPILSAAGLPCTISVVSSFAEDPAYTWWDTLAWRGLLSQERRDRALLVQRGLASEVLSDARLSLPPGTLPDALLPAPWERIASEAGSGVALGSHTVRHANLAALAEDELEEELRESQRDIGERTGTQPEAVAYPYGLWTPKVLKAAAHAGYRVGLVLDGPLFSGRQSLLEVPRINIPAAMSIDTLACRAAGINLRRFWRLAT